MNIKKKLVSAVLSSVMIIGMAGVIPASADYLTDGRVYYINENFEDGQIPSSLYKDYKLTGQAKQYVSVVNDTDKAMDGYYLKIGGTDITSTDAATEPVLKLSEPISGDVGMLVLEYDGYIEHLGTASDAYHNNKHVKMHMTNNINNTETGDMTSFLIKGNINDGFAGDQGKPTLVTGSYSSGTSETKALLKKKSDGSNLEFDGKKWNHYKIVIDFNTKKSVAYVNGVESQEYTLYGTKLMKEEGYYLHSIGLYDNSIIQGVIRHRQRNGVLIIFSYMFRQLMQPGLQQVHMTET